MARLVMADLCGTDKFDKNWTWTNYVSARALAQAENVRSQLQRTMERFEIELVSLEDERILHLAIRQALVCGFFMHVAHKEGEKNSYLTVKDNQVGLLVICRVIPTHHCQGCEPTPVLWTGYTARLGHLQ